MESAFRKTWIYVLTAITLVALSVGAFAQGGIGELTGQVTDTTGAVVSGVQVKLTNTATGEVRTTCDHRGWYLSVSGVADRGFVHPRNC